MGTWFEDFSNNTPEEIVGFDAENTKFGRSVRVRVKMIIESKLAGEINSKVISAAAGDNINSASVRKPKALTANAPIGSRRLRFSSQKNRTLTAS